MDKETRLTLEIYRDLLTIDYSQHSQFFGKMMQLVELNSDTFIDNVCLSYRHDFGLMAEQDRQRLRFECKEWMRAISNNWEYFKNGL